MIVLAIIALIVSSFMLGYYTCQGRLQKKVDEYVGHHTYEDDDNPPGSL